MKGLMNNEEAVRVFHNIKDSMINPIHHIYNLGYKQGYEDGHKDCMQKLTEQILAERENDGTVCSYGVSANANQHTQRIESVRERRTDEY